MFYKKYEPEVLEKLQKIELEILKDFADLCERNGIDYFGVGGTAIGVMRHGGFIPWDDDIDIGLTRKNYNKFLEVAAKEYPDKYKIINAETTQNYPLTTTRWARRGSKFKEECFKDVDMDNGIFLDLFCFDNIADDEKKMRRQGWTAWFWGKLMILRTIKKPVIYVEGFKAKLILFCSAVGHSLLKLFHISPKFLYRKAMKAARKYEQAETKRVAYFFDPTPFTSIMKIEDIEPTKVYEYSGLKIRFPHKTEAYLEVRYGDYMTLPPEDKRHNHPPYILEFPEEE